MPMSNAPTAPTMKSSTKYMRTPTSHRASIISSAIGNTPTTACALTSPSPTSPRWNSSPTGKTTHERQSVTNLLDEYKWVTRTVPDVRILDGVGVSLSQGLGPKLSLRRVSNEPRSWYFLLD